MGRILLAFVSEAKDVEAGFVAVDEFLAVWEKRFASLFSDRSRRQVSSAV
jgi:hypothetical protein